MKPTLALKVVPFLRPVVSPFVGRLDPVDLASLDVEQAAHDLSVVIHAAYTVDQALELRRRVERLVKLLSDVEALALAKASTLCG